jgi:hypothetical protein
MPWFNKNIGRSEQRPTRVRIDSMTKTGEEVTDQALGEAGWEWLEPRDETSELPPESFNQQ